MRATFTRSHSLAVWPVLKSHPAVLEHWRNNFKQMRATRTENQSMRVIRVGGGLENRSH